MPSRYLTAACAARQDQIVERVLVFAQSMMPVRSRQNGSSGNDAATGSAPVTISPSNRSRVRSAMSVYSLSTRHCAASERLTDGSEKQWKRMRTLLAAAAVNRRMNCRSVAFSAVSGMLLMSPIVSSAGCANTSSRGASAGLSIGRCRSNRRVMLTNYSAASCRRSDGQAFASAWSMSSMMSAECSMPIREADGFRQHAGDALLLRCHLAMRGARRMAGERLCIADIDEPRDQLQRVVEGLAGLHAALDAEGEPRRGVAVEIFLDQRIVGAVGETGVIDPVDTRIAAQEFGDLACVLDMPLDAQRHGLDALQQQERIERRQHGTHRPLIDAARALDIGPGPETIRGDEAVLGHVGWLKAGKTSACAAHGNRPLSTMAPPSVVPWPPKKFVSEWIAMSAP